MKVRDYVVCECSSLVDTLVCAPVKFPDYELESIHLGPTGAFAVAEKPIETEPKNLYGRLRDFLGTAKIGLYLKGNGLLLSADGAVDLQLTDTELQEVIHEQTQNGHFLLWDPEMLRKISEKIRHEDARNRGIYRDNDGNWFIAQHGKFRPMSNKDPDEILRLTLYGGILGAHRFALGKWLTGLIYLLTGGLMGLGWLMDLLQIHLGTLKDKKKRFLPKPAPPSLPRYLFGILINTALFCVYSVATGVISGIAMQISA